MNVLLDTHIAIWAVMDSEKLDEKLTGILEDVDNNIYFSTANLTFITHDGLLKGYNENCVMNV